MIIQNRFALGVFLDIQGAFDNVSVDALIKAMQDKNFPEVFINWYRSYLKYKTVTINHEGMKVKRFLTCITPQGGVLSPLAWNIAFESLSQIFSKGQVKICGFAGDACLIATGESPLLLRFIMQEAIDKALAWGKSRGLQFSGPQNCGGPFYI